MLNKNHKLIDSEVYNNYIGPMYIKIKQLPLLIKTKLIYLFYPFVKKNIKNETYAFMEKYGITQKLFFPRSFKKKNISSIYKDLLTEQDKFSPHRYVENY